MKFRAFPTLALALLLAPLLAPLARAAEPAPSPRTTLPFDRDWRFVRQDVPDAQSPAFDDAAWQPVTTPHTYNDVDSFHRIISHSGGQRDAYAGPAWYRKSFTLPESAKGQKVVLEFEGLKQAARFYLNGKEIGLYENGVTAFGLDLTAAANFGTAPNVLAIRVDNSNDYKETATGATYQWMGRAFNPNYGGINRHVRLHLLPPLHQTLPLWEGLRTTGIYVYADNIAPPSPSATEPGGGLDLHVESQVANGLPDNANTTLSVAVLDDAGKEVARFEGDTVDLVAGEKTRLSATARVTGLRLWSPDSPALYTVRTTLTVDGKVADVADTRTGFRKVEFKGGAGTGGVYLNGKFLWLTGFAQRSTNEWAGLGQAYPDWMHDLTAQLIRKSNSNYVRWMHIAPQKVDVDAFDRAGIVQACPAGDKEKDAEGPQWDQRMAVMRATMVYYRNAPSIFFWEAGNNSITTPHLQQMLDLRKELDPAGGRAMGCRTLNDAGATPLAEYFGVMVGQDRRTDALKGPSDQFRAYSAERRDRVPMIETEDFRDEAARRFWDDVSPPHFGFKKGPDDTWGWTSETFALAAVQRYTEYDRNRIDNPDPARAKWSGYASIYFSDSNADGRQNSSEVCRVSGKVDAVRLPKQIYFATRVMQSPTPDLHILGHWTYPAGTTKTVYVIANTDAVELRLNGKSLGKQTRPVALTFTDFKVSALAPADRGFIFAFESVPFAPGQLEAVGYNKDRPAARMSLTTAGPPAALRLTPTLNPAGFTADGADVALIDIEVIDADGNRCPTDESRIDFTLTGPAVFRGGYNSGLINSTNNLHLNTECGINRIALRSTPTPGPLTLTATRQGLPPTTLTLTSK